MGAAQVQLAWIALRPLRSELNNQESDRALLAMAKAVIHEGERAGGIAIELES